MKRYFIEADGHIIEIDFEKYLRFLDRCGTPRKSFGDTIKDLKSQRDLKIGFSWVQTSMDMEYYPYWSQVTFYWEEDLD